jgi:hypothetical protein
MRCENAMDPRAGSADVTAETRRGVIRSRQIYHGAENPPEEQRTAYDTPGRGAGSDVARGGFSA